MQGHITSFGAADIADATKCIQPQQSGPSQPSQPSCTHTFPDQTSPDPANGTTSTFYFEFEPVGCTAPATSSGLTRSTMTVSGSLGIRTLGCAAEEAVTNPDCRGPYESIEAAMKSSPNGYEALSSTGDIAIEWGYVIARDPKDLGKPAGTGGYYTTPPVRSSAKNHTMDVEKDYGRSWGLCPAYETFDLAATVHTHPENWLNENFTASDFSQGIQFKRLIGDEAGKVLNQEPPDKEMCVEAPKDPNQHLSAFEEIVMIYVGDRMVRTFKPKLGDCSFSGIAAFLMNNLVPLGPTWSGYVDRTCILPWKYAEGAKVQQLGQPIQAAYEAAYTKCKEQEDQ